MDNEPILYSLASFGEWILSALELAGARRIVEIGSEYGKSTQRLCAYAERAGGQLITVDPCLQPEAQAFVASQQGNPHFRFLQSTSLEALPALADADAFIIDGDHNYFTVRHELEAIARHRGAAPWLVFEHDVCWPWGRRDLYYDPDRIPACYRHPYGRNGGVTLDAPGLVRGGFGDGNTFAIALAEGGPENGVRTAIEDFLAEHPELKFEVIPVIFGLGVLYSRRAPWSEALAALLRPFADNPLLERLERNRLELSLHRLRHPAAPLLPPPEFPPGRHVLEVCRAPDREAFARLWEARLTRTIEAQSALSPTGTASFTLSGYCAACGAVRDFTTDFMFASPDAEGRLLPAWRERQICECRLNCRQRSCFHLLTESLGLGPDARVYCTEQQTDLFRHIRRAFPGALGSEFFGRAVPPGSVNADGIRNEDVTRLTFPDGSFDCVFSLDVMEHVPDFRAGLSEMARCLKPGGKLLLTTPFCFDKDTTVVRATVNPDGSLTHHLPPVYHGDPINPQGALCFNDFGWDFMDDLRAAGFGDATVFVFTAPHFGYVGLQYIFLATRCPATAAARNNFAWPYPPSARRQPAHPAAPRFTEPSDALSERAAALQRERRWEEAEPIFSELTKRHPDDFTAWWGRLHCHQARGHGVLAGLVREEALERHPEWAAGLAEDQSTPEESHAC